jgi:hypothetical protein
MKKFKKIFVSGLVATMVIVFAAVGLATAEDTITGTVAEQGDAIVLAADDGTYILEGSDMAPEMVGKKVKVTGTVAEKAEGRVISVFTMEEVKE